MDCIWNKCIHFDQASQTRSDRCDECLRFNLGATEDLAERLPLTNADCIRSMNDEELAEFLISFSTKKAIKAANKVFVTRTGIVDWLKQPAKCEIDKYIEDCSVCGFCEVTKENKEGKEE